MTETGDGTAGARLDEQFLRNFSARWHTAWNSHDHHQVAALCTDDVEWHDPSLPGPGHGAGAIAGLMQTLVRACPDFRFEETEPAYPSPIRPHRAEPRARAQVMRLSPAPPWLSQVVRVLLKIGTHRSGQRGAAVILVGSFRIAPCGAPRQAGAAGDGDSRASRGGTPRQHLSPLQGDRSRAAAHVRQERPDRANEPGDAIATPARSPPCTVSDLRATRPLRARKAAGRRRRDPRNLLHVRGPVR